MKKNKKLLVLSVLLSIVVIFGGLIIPKQLIDKSAAKEISIVNAVPATYYSGTTSAIAKNASAQLSDYQRLRLITGVWASKVEPADLSEAAHSEFEIVSIAQDEIVTLYKHKMYPENIVSDYGNWYSWTTNLYKAIDTTFNTYTSYFWIINFTRYDANTHHKVIISDSGKVLFAEMYSDYETIPNPIDDAGIISYKKLVNDYVETSVNTSSSKEYSVISENADVTETIGKYLSIQSITDNEDLSLPLENYLSKINLICIGSSSMKTKDEYSDYYNSELSQDKEFYYLGQSYYQNTYSIFFIPYNE